MTTRERYHNEINIPFSTLIDKVITDIREKKFDVVRFVRKAETIFHRIAAIEVNILFQALINYLEEKF